MQGFRLFDYGKQQNMKLYGTETPPNYNLLSIRIPVLLYLGHNDAFTQPQVSIWHTLLCTLLGLVPASRLLTSQHRGYLAHHLYAHTSKDHMSAFLIFFQDVEYLKAQLPNVAKIHYAESPKFTHFEFFVGNTVTEEIFQPMVQDMNKYPWSEIQGITQPIVTYQARRFTRVYEKRLRYIVSDTKYTRMFTQSPVPPTNAIPRAFPGGKL